MKMIRAKWLIFGALAIALTVGLSACLFFLPLPKAVIEATPQAGTAPLEVTFDISGSQGQTYTLDFGDGSDPDVGVDFNVPIQHTYEDPGTYEATLTVEDARGNTDTASVTIDVGYPPVKAVIEVEVQTPPYTFAFDGSASEGAIDTYILDFGDGTFIGGDWDTAVWPVYHTYPVQTASYTVTLWVQDVYGNDDQDKEIVNTPAP